MKTIYKLTKGLLTVYPCIVLYCIVHQGAIVESVLSNQSMPNSIALNSWCFIYVEGNVENLYEKIVIYRNRDVSKSFPYCERLEDYTVRSLTLYNPQDDGKIAMLGILDLSFK